MPKITFSNNNNEFYQSLKSAVDDYFTSSKIKKTGNWKLYLKTIVLIGSAVTCYCLIIFGKLSALPAFAICALQGYFMACIGFSVMHDANHGSYSTKPWVNDLLGMSMNFMGASSFFWKQKHNIIHHTYTNVDGIDDDIAKSPIIRQCETQRWVPAHKVQHLYLLPAYALSSIFWVFSMDFVKYFTRKIYTTDAWKMSTKNHVVFWATKVLYAFFYMALPIMLFGFLPWLLGFFIMHAFMGLTMSLVFQLAHVVENTEFENIALDETKHIETAWAEHQIKTTSNFAMRSKIVSWFVGGLNFQIEHHLFPKVSHVHYPALSKIVQQKCTEYNLTYNYYGTFAEALVSHFRVMRQLGRKPAVLQQQIAA